MFAAKPWFYAPAYGGFCSWGVCGEAPDNTPNTTLWLPAANHLQSWIRYKNRTFMNKDSGAMGKFQKGMDQNIATGDKFFELWFGNDKENWPFNAACCDTDEYPRM